MVSILDSASLVDVEHIQKLRKDTAIIRERLLEIDRNIKDLRLDLRTRERESTELKKELVPYLAEIRAHEILLERGKRKSPPPLVEDLS